MERSMALEAKVQDAVALIITCIEELEAQVRVCLAEKGNFRKDVLMPGWIRGIDFSWEQDLDTGVNRYSWRLDCNGVLDVRNRFRSDTQTDLSFLSKRCVQKDMIPALQAWFSQKVENEVYGGVYDCDCTLEVRLRVESVKRPVLQEFKLEASCAERTAAFEERALRFISEKHYEKVRIEDVYSSLGKVVLCAAKGFSEQLSYSELELFFDGLFSKAGNEWIYVTSLIDGGGQYVDDLAHNHTYHDVQPTALQLDLCCYFGQKIMMHPVADPNEKERGKWILEFAAGIGSKKAKQIMKQGTGTVDERYLSYQDEYISCKANDMERVVCIKFVNTSQQAFGVAVKFIMALLSHGFPASYRIECKPRSKAYSTGTEQFWRMCAQYPGLHPLMRDYVMGFMIDGAYYVDTGGEDAVPVGGYAAHALALADVDNSDVVEWFMQNVDSEHVLLSDELAEGYIEKYGVTEENAGAVVACIVGAANNAMFCRNFGGLEDVGVLRAFVQAMEAQGISSYHVDVILRCVWGGPECLEERIGDASKGDDEEKRELFKRLMEMAEG